MFRCHSAEGLKHDCYLHFWFSFKFTTEVFCSIFRTRLFDQFTVVLLAFVVKHFGFHKFLSEKGCMMFQIKWIEQQVVKRRVKRDVQSMFNDPQWPQQWYLVSIASVS